MEKTTKFVIDGPYSFGTTIDGARPTVGTTVKDVHIQLSHDEVMKMGKSFEKEKPYYLEPYEDFGLLNIITPLLVEAKIEERIADREEENADLPEDERTEVNRNAIEDEVWEDLGMSMVEWNKDLVKQCITYYNEHK